MGNGTIRHLNGWAGKASNTAKPILSNKVAATVNDIYKREAVKWLESNIPDWKTAFKFQ